MERPKGVRRESGQALVEYVLLLVFAVIFSLAVYKSLDTTLKNGLTSFNGTLEQCLRTGSYRQAEEMRVFTDDDA